MIKRLFIMLTLLTLTMALFACGDDSAAEKCASGHTYDNECDSKCNVCEKTRTVSEHIYDTACDTECNECGKERTSTPHTYDNGCDSECNLCGDLRIPWEHVYDNECDTECNKCGKARTPGDHIYFNGCDASCNECGEIRTPANHKDGNGDYLCDVCSEDMPRSLALIEGKLVNFKFVLSKDTSSDVRRMLETDITRKLRAFDVIATITTEGWSNDTEQEMEILIGDVKSRGEKYDVDEHTLGKEGYVIKIIGNKVVITAGSDAKLADVLMQFANGVLGIGGEDIFDVTMTDADCSSYVQNGYSIKSVSVCGNNIENYTIALDLTNSYHTAAAKLLQDLLYERVGIWLETVDISEADNSIVFKSIPKVSGENSFRIYTNGKQLIIECAYDNMLDTAFSEFLDVIREGEGRFNFVGQIMKRDISVIYYDDFGAVGDGVTDDFDAIYAAHTLANVSGQTVKAREGAVYYIFNSHEKTITVKTNVDWCGAEFIIDDREISPISGGKNYALSTYNIFTIAHDEAAIQIKDSDTLNAILADGLNPDTKKININIDGWDGPVMIVPYNSSHKVYRRRGYSTYTGASMNEVIVLDSDGNVSPETPIMFYYSDITSIYVYKLDESSAVTVENGTFTTRASQTNRKSGNSAKGGYIDRGISVTRSYTTLKSIKHYVTDEMPLSEQVDEDGNIVKVGAIYHGFFSASNANHVTFEDCVLTGRRCYTKVNEGADGTYDLSATRVNKIVLKNCTQSNFWVTVDEDYNIHPANEGDEGAVLSMSSIKVNGKSLKMHWGIGGTNYCKNMEYIGSTLSRLDAHAGLYNGKIIDSTVNYISLTGGGEFVVENSRWFAEGSSSASNSIFHLRNDYGSTWSGNITVKNLEAYTHTSASSYIFYHTYNNWYYGYICHFPNISIDNLDFYNIKTFEPLSAGYEIKLTGTSISKTSKRHLAQSHTAPYFSVLDADKDGYVDEPIIDADLDGILDTNLDLDGDGRIGNTSIEYATATKNTSGIKHPASYVNLNIVVPPEYIKITGNDGADGKGGYVYVITDTSGGGISDGGYYDDVESFGGFFGDTRFYYSDTEYFVGTAHTEQDKTSTLKFK